MELMMIPFASFMIVRILDRLLKNPKVKVVLTVVMLIISLLGSYYWVSTTRPALNKSEIWALDIIKAKKDVNTVFVTNTFYAPWAYGFTGKHVIAPGIFDSVWTFDQFLEYQKGNAFKKVQMLLDLSREHGEIYLFQGSREFAESLKDRSPLIKEVFFVNGARIYEISSPDF